MEMKVIFVAIAFACCISCVISSGSENETHSVFSYLENDVVAAKASSAPQPLMITLTLIQGAASKGAGKKNLFALFSFFFWSFLFLHIVTTFSDLSLLKEVNSCNYLNI